MTLRLVALLLGLLLASCASTLGASNALPLSSANLQMNISPGKYVSWRTSVSLLTEPISLRVSFDRLQPSEEWKSLISVCLLETVADQEDICLRFEPHPTQKSKVLATLVDWPSGEKRELANSDDSQLPLELSKASQVYLEHSASGIRFSVNGKLIHVYSSAKTYHAVSLSCSSSACTLSDIQ